MNPESNNSHYVRRVVLPSGKTIEVVYFEDQDPVAERPERPAPPAPSSQPAADLHLCGTCDSSLVYPTDWDEAGLTHWEVTLRCPNCEWTGCGVYEQGTVERFDEELDRGTEALVRDLKRLMHVNMQEEIDRFVSALDSGHIVPDDF